jgi:PKD repeat protein
VYVVFYIDIEPYLDLPAGIPAASFIMRPDYVIEGESITFDASSSYDPDGGELIYEWDFGDGSTAKGRVVTHTFTSLDYKVPETYIVKLTVRNSKGLSNHAYQPVVCNKRPLIMRTPQGTLICDNKYTFDAKGFVDFFEAQGFTISGVEWNFDGTVIDGTTADYTYQSQGSHKLKCSLSLDDIFGRDIFTYAEIDNNPVDVTFEASFKTVKVNRPVTFYADVTSPNGSMVKYIWDFGDGTRLEGTLIENIVENPESWFYYEYCPGYKGSVEHIYTRPGEYQVMLTVIDEAGVVGTGSLIISVAGLKAEFDISLDVVKVGQEVQFDASASKGTSAIIKYEWDFGDGTRAQGMQITHTYSHGGGFNVTLKVTDENGLSDQLTRVILVVEGSKSKPGCGMLGVEVLLLLVLLYLTRRTIR